jgi:hypothetical protein
MIQNLDLKEIDNQIQIMKKAAEELKEMGHEFPALLRNATRILASIKMLEINISDMLASDH